MTCAVQVPEKDTKTAFRPKKRTLAFLRDLGYEFCTVLLKSDGELAIEAVYEIAMERDAVQTIMEECSKASSGASRSAEGAIQCALAARWRKGISDEHPVLA